LRPRDFAVRSRGRHCDTFETLTPVATLV